MKEAALLLTFLLPLVDVSERLDASVFTAETWNIRGGPYWRLYFWTYRVKMVWKTIFEWRSHIKFCAFWVDVRFLVPLPLLACLFICFVLCTSFRRTSNLTYYEVMQLVGFHTRGGRCDFWIAPGWRAAPSARAISVLLSAYDPHAKFDSGVADTRFFVTRTSSG